MKWIHESPQWPRFFWDYEALWVVLADIRYRQGRLFGTMQNLGFVLQRETRVSVATEEAVSSSSIEGERLNAREVRSSVARRLHVDTADAIPVSRHVDGMVEMTLDAVIEYDKKITGERMWGWHAALFPTGRSGMKRIEVGQWRTGPMQVISGSMGKETVHYEAPSPSRLEHEMDEFLSWCNRDDVMDPVLKAGVAHFWFLSIHPFEDGNGRIARALSDLFLARGDASEKRFYSLSRQIEKEKRDYYRVLETQQRNSTDITMWLEWFLGCLGRALTHAETTVSSILFRSHFWKILHAKGVNERQRLIITRMLEDDFKGFMNTSTYAKMAKCSTDTALRDITDLMNKGIIIRNEAGGRSTSYRLVTQLEPER